MKLYIVFINYGLEGWKLYEESDSLEMAIKFRESAMGLGNSDVVILKRVDLQIEEIE